MSHVCLTCTENLNRVVRSGDGMHTAFRKAHEMKGINDEATLQALAAHDRAAVEQAARLFRLVENTGINYSSVFTPLLGRLDEAARGILRRRLRPAMPSNTPDRERWLGPKPKPSRSGDADSLPQNGAEFEGNVSLQQRYHAAWSLTLLH